MPPLPQLPPAQNRFDAGLTGGSGTPRAPGSPDAPAFPPPISRLAPPVVPPFPPVPPLPAAPAPPLAEMVPFTTIFRVARMGCPLTVSVTPELTVYVVACGVVVSVVLEEIVTAPELPSPKYAMPENGLVRLLKLTEPRVNLFDDASGTGSAHGANYACSYAGSSSRARGPTGSGD